MKKISLLRSNPRDTFFERVALLLLEENAVDCYLWDRDRDYEPPPAAGNVLFQKCGIRAGYHTPGTFLKLFLFQAWLFMKLITARHDAIHAFDLDTGLIGWITARLRGKKIIYHCLDPYPEALPPAWPRVLARFAHALENFVISHSDLFIITDYLRMPQHAGARPVWTVEFANVPFQIGPTTAAKTSSFTVGYIGSLVEGRNLRTIIESVGEMENRGIRLVIGGFGPLKEEIRRLSSRYRNVTFIDWVSYGKLLEYEQSFDVLLHMADPAHPAQKWVSPNKFFESMALGKPLIAAAGTLTGERVGKIGNGVTVHYGSKIDLQKSILLLKDDAELAKDMGNRGRQEYERNWKPDIMKERLLNAYRALLSANTSDCPKRGDKTRELT